MTTVSSCEQLWNAVAPMAVTLAGIEIAPSAVQPENADVPIVFTCVRHDIVQDTNSFAGTMLIAPHLRATRSKGLILHTTSGAPAGTCPCKYDTQGDHGSDTHVFLLYDRHSAQTTCEPTRARRSPSPTHHTLSLAPCDAHRVGNVHRGE